MTAPLADAQRIDSCRACGSGAIDTFLSLGDMPLANAFRRPGAADAEARYPLELARCAKCGLVQLTVIVRPDILFNDYAYASSASRPMVAHFDDLAELIAKQLGAAGRLVVEIGSNDGILLAPLRRRGAKALGIEPAANLAALANAAGNETWNVFFDESIARQIVAERGMAAVVVGNNVLAHIADLPGVARSLALLLDADGVFVAEIPYLVDLIDRVEYDTIYHEHLSYFHLAPLEALFARHDLELFHADRLTVHGGSLRIRVARPGTHKRSDGLNALLASEDRAGLASERPVADFARRVEESREALRDMLASLRSAEKRIAGYGATAKGNTLLNYCGIGTETLEFIADSTPYKQGLLTPGTHIPVVPESAILERRPDFALLLAWNHADAIIASNADFLRSGGRFIHPVPMARVLE
jgi:novobiocin biosynthesis protein NovU/D-mycarose 3-C-methyltransferase